MAKNDDKIEEIINNRVDSVLDKRELKWRRFTCKTSMTAAFLVIGTVGKWIMDHSDRAFGAMHFLIYGDLPK